MIRSSCWQMSPQGALINRELGKTIIMVTHDPWMASHCSRVVLLKDGIILDELKCRNVMDTFYQEILGRMSEL